MFYVIMDKFETTLFRLIVLQNLMIFNQILFTSKCVLLGLDALNSKNNDHIDIKPQNNIINSLGHVKITDFNSAQ